MVTSWISAPAKSDDDVMIERFGTTVGFATSSTERPSNIKLITASAAIRPHKAKSRRGIALRVGINH